MDATPRLCTHGTVVTSVSCWGTVHYRVDPFAHEIYDDDSKVFICEQHEYERAVDI